MKLKILTVFSLILVFSACTYYEHGPVISFNSAKTRLAGEWELTDVIINDNTDEVLLESEKNTKYVFIEDGSLIIKNIELKRSSETMINGNWEFNDKKTSIIINIEEDCQISFIDCQEMTILRLTNDELWISDENAPGRENNFITERRFKKI
ncbi:MAG: DUF5004 domain-containing protein [Bacteroidales bacterium]|nr:DUF5004 domain-containing protein [Bacteroidales bacterium]MDD4218138.1 DUF5004 domain-containing protein [Bacteroidales bacterium]MDY0140903.1 DUF5004 domain-containing protein [Bacteroidales bacterium]